jgi:hypothetical protein
MLREKGSIRADDVTVRAMRNEGLDSENRKLPADFTRRILGSDFAKAGTVEKIGRGRGVRRSSTGDPIPAGATMELFKDFLF